MLFRSEMLRWVDSRRMDGGVRRVGPNAVRLALDHRRELRNEAPPVAVILPEHVKARDAHVQPHRLEPYDQLKEQADE